MRSWATLLALFAAVLGLGLWVYYKGERQPDAAYALSALRAHDVKRVRFERPQRSPGEGTGAPGTTQEPATSSAVVLERTAADWRIVAPFPARADSFQVERMLSILDARSGARYRADDLPRYGLDRPLAVVTLQDQTFAYGAINTMTREQYVLTRDQVYLVPLAYVTGLPRDVDSLLAKQILGAGEAPARFELPGFSVTHADGRWTLSSASNDASADERHAWVDRWRHATALRTARSGAHPPVDIRVHLEDGRTIDFGIVQRDTELVLLRHDEGIEYHFPADAGRRLLSPPGAQP
jgi:hypothetical protein